MLQREPVQKLLLQISNLSICIGAINDTFPVSQTEALTKQSRVIFEYSASILISFNVLDCHLIVIIAITGDMKQLR